MSSATPPAPPGWYPDPGGERQWRVWTGSQWSETTRPYAPVPRASREVVLAPAGGLDHLRRFGVPATFAGLGLLVSVLAHWPGNAHPVPAWFALGASDLAVGLLALGAFVYALAARTLAGRWSVAAVVPGINVAYVSGLLSERLTGTWPTRRVVSEVILLVLFVAQAHAAPWLALAPVLVGLSHYALAESYGQLPPERVASIES